MFAREIRSLNGHEGNLSIKQDMTLSNGCRKFPTWSKFLWANQGQNSFERTVGLFRGCSTDLSSAMCGKVRTPLQFAVACQSVNVISELPISAMKRLQCAFSNFITWLQNAWSSNRRQPRYSDPSCEISRKQRLGGRVSDRKTALSVPTSPLGVGCVRPCKTKQAANYEGHGRSLAGGLEATFDRLERVPVATFQPTNPIEKTRPRSSGIGESTVI